MKKYTFLVYHRALDQFLSDIRDLGVVHVSCKGTGLADDAALQTLIDKADELRHTIQQGSPDDLLRELDALEQQRTTILKQIRELALWGDYSAQRIEQLANAGYSIRCMYCQSKVFDNKWGVIVAQTGGTTYFVQVMRTDDQQLDIPQDCHEVILGPKNAIQLQSDIDALNRDIEAKKTAIDDWKKVQLPILENELHQLDKQIDWQRVSLSTDSLAEGALSLLEGFCPLNKTDELNAVLDKEMVYYEASDPLEDDMTPIKLRNNRFISMFECLTGMYGWPKYQEFDPTPILGPFFLLFFSLCIGDAGYGLLLVLVGYLIKKEKLKIEMFSGMGPIIMALGVGSTVIGYMMGGFFGMDLYAATWFPQAGKSIMFKGLFGEKIAGYDVMMVLALVIGVVHICLAMTIKCISFTKQHGFRRTVADWGWLLLILGSLIALVIGGIMNWGVLTTKWVLIGIAIVSGLGIFPLNTPGRNPLTNTGAGLWSAYQMVTGVLGDVLSYIRLYALGLAGGMLGQAFNQLAEMVLGDVPNIGTWIGFIAILTFGHVLNLLMACLGAFVHPLRLSFVEYFKNSGYEGSGRLYQPFKA